MIRPYTTNDLEAIIAIWAKAEAQAHSFLPQDVRDQIRKDVRNIYLPNAETWVIEQDGHPVGFIAMFGTEIDGLFLDPAQQRKGLGRQMVDFVADLRGPLTVEVFKDNKVGLPFYERYGFVVTGEDIFEPSGHGTVNMEMPAT